MLPALRWYSEPAQASERHFVPVELGMAHWQELLRSSLAADFHPQLLQRLGLEQQQQVL